jgi:hypothetical protein
MQPTRSTWLEFMALRLHLGDNSANPSHPRFSPLAASYAATLRRCWISKFALGSLRGAAASIRGNHVSFDPMIKLGRGGLL